MLLTLQPLVSYLFLLNVLLNISDDHLIVLLQPNRGPLHEISLRKLTCSIIWNRNHYTVGDGRVA
jgi:hypothetical protein